ncbi:hypothetical protein [Comamonas terrae]|uniref:Uncharacterized protein n=1 Tax=Comamonas terrae TaxID=673548 RepID=A0ABW5USH6_9BURK|nr:hypothetical protein [Comamonas terrae]
MARISIGAVSFDMASGTTNTAPAAAYANWAAELSVPSSGTLQNLDADDLAFPLYTEHGVLGVSRISCFASEGGLGLYDTTPEPTNSVSVSYPGVNRMYGFGMPAPIFFTFHPPSDCNSEGTRVQRAAAATILTGRIRSRNDGTSALDFAVRLAKGGIQFLLAPVGLLVSFKVFGAPGQPEVANIDMTSGTTTQIDITGLPYRELDGTPALARGLMTLGRTPAIAYGAPYVAQDGYLSVERGCVKDYVSGVLGQGVGRVYGTVKRKDQPANVPLKRRVRLVRERDGLVMREIWSDPITGEYDFRYIDELQTWTVIAYDYEHNFRAVIADNITPEVMS